MIKIFIFINYISSLYKSRLSRWTCLKLRDDFKSVDVKAAPQILPICCFPFGVLTDRPSVVVQLRASLAQLSAKDHTSALFLPCRLPPPAEYSAATQQPCAGAAMAPLALLQWLEIPQTKLSVLAVSTRCTAQQQLRCLVRGRWWRQRSPNHHRILISV